MSSGFLLTPTGYFTQMVDEGLQSRKLKAHPSVQRYLVQLLEHFLDSRNLFIKSEFEGRPQPTTLAEMYLLAQQKETANRQELLRKTGDRALYISGFFGDSLNRKLVDIEYYAQIGGAAYRCLSHTVKDEESVTIYTTFSDRFMDYVDVLTVISHKSMIQSDQGIIHLYDKYLKTGSELARERLVEMGLFHLAKDHLKKEGA